jgi:hypothetical protein
VAYNFSKGYGDEEDKIDYKRIDQIRMLNILEEKSYILARVENKYKNHSTGVKTGGRNISKRYDNLKKEYESQLADVILTISQINNKIDEFPEKDRTFIKGLIKAYKKHDTIGLFE